MKTIIVTLISLLATAISAFAQDFQGMAVYESKTSTADMMANFAGNREITPEMKKNIEERMKSAFEKTFILIFDKTTSTYKEEEKIEQPGQSGGGMRMMGSMMGGGGTQFKNVKDKTYTVDKEFFGKEFLIVEPLVQPEWKLIDETKKIGDYNCFKAELVIPVSEKQKKEYEEFLKKEEKKPALFKMEKPEDKVITAWYTPEIPVNFGPDNYWGLPGLILEVSEEKLIILCSKVVLSNKEKTKIKAPNTGEKVSQKKFDEIQKKKTDSMKDEDGVIMFQH